MNKTIYEAFDLSRKKGKSILYALVLLTVFSLPGCKPQAKPMPQKSSEVIENLIDLQGREVYFVGSGGTSFKSGSKLEDNDAYKIGDERAKREEKNLLKLQDKYNCTLVWASSSLEYLKKSILEGNPTGDVWLLSELELLDNFLQGLDKVMISLDEYSDILDIDDPTIWDLSVQNFFNFGGKTQLLYQNLNTTIIPQLVFNKSMMIDNGLWDEFNLYNMQRNKSWTWEAFRQVCERITADTDSDGMIDRFGIFYKHEMLENFFVSNGDGNINTSLISIDENGDARLTINEPAQKETLDFLLSLNESGYMNSDADMFYTYPEIQNGNALFDIGGVYSISYLEKDTNKDFGSVAIPIGPNNTNKEYYNKKRIGIGMGIIKDAKNPEALAYILRDYVNPLFNDEEWDKYRENYCKTQIGCDDEEIEIFKLVFQSDVSVPDLRLAFYRQLGDDFYETLGEVFTGKMTKEHFLKNFVSEKQQEVSSYWNRVKTGIDDFNKS